MPVVLTFSNFSYLQEPIVTKQSSKRQPTLPLNPSEKQPSSPTFYAILSLLACLLGVGLLFLFITVAGDPNTGGPVFYIVLIAMGAAASSFLFGSMQSYAAYSGKVLGGLMELGGPVVLFALVVIGGFWLVPRAGSFDVTVYVHGPGGKTDRVLTNRGKVMMELGQFPRTALIRENGDAHFDGIPSEFFDREVLVMIEADGFESAKPDTKLLLKGESVYLEVKRDDSLSLVFGYVQTGDGTPLNEVDVSMRDEQTKTKKNGYFEMRIPEEYQANEYLLMISHKDYKPVKKLVRPGSEITVRLKELTK
jgi:hypothetical protein